MKRKMEHKKGMKEGARFSKMPHGPTPPGKPMTAAKAPRVRGEHAARAKRLKGMKM